VFLGFLIHYITSTGFTQDLRQKNKKGVMIMPVYKSNNATKDGRVWFFKTGYKDAFNNSQVKVSKKFATKTEAKDEERKFLNSITVGIKPSNLTFEQLCKSFMDNRKDKIRPHTYRQYQGHLKYFEMFNKVKCSSMTFDQYQTWRDFMNNTKLNTKSKNTIYKTLKAIINYGIRFLEIDMVSLANRMSNFTDPAEPKKEMLFYTYDEFKQFISVEDDIRYKCVFEIAYYCGLRHGELRGLTWADIDFEHKLMTINKQVTRAWRSENKKPQFDPLKTPAAYRTLPICDILYDDLKELYFEQSKPANFDKSFFVLSYTGLAPIDAQSVADRKERNCELAKIKNIRMHDFRHSCASLLINSGAKITLVSKFLGHENVSVTLNTYAHMFKSDLDSVVNVINVMTSK
jgi:integrase